MYENLVKLVNESESFKSKFDQMPSIGETKDGWKVCYSGGAWRINLGVNKDYTEFDGGKVITNATIELTSDKYPKMYPYWFEFKYPSVNENCIIDISNKIHYNYMVNFEGKKFESFEEVKSVVDEFAFEWNQVNYRDNLVKNSNQNWDFDIGYGYTDAKSIIKAIDTTFIGRNTIRSLNTKNLDIISNIFADLRGITYEKSRDRYLKSFRKTYRNRDNN